MNKEELKDTLKSILKEVQDKENNPHENNSETDIQTMLSEILQEVREIRRDKVKHDEEMKEIRDDYAKLLQTVTQQQKFMEELDRKERSKNIVITGVSESKDLEEAHTDVQKCERILEKIGVSGISYTHKRIGKQIDHRDRPLLLECVSATEKENILANTSALKQAGPAYQKVFVKKDIHPAVRREWWRLKDAEKKEKEKPENVGCSIHLDTKQRVLLRDGNVIDRWSPTYFR